MATLPDSPYRASAQTTHGEEILTGKPELEAAIEMERRAVAFGLLRMCFAEYVRRHAAGDDPAAAVTAVQHFAVARMQAFLDENADRVSPRDFAPVAMLLREALQQAEAEIAKAAH